MRALAGAIAARPPPPTHAGDGFEDENEDDEQFHNACLDEIDRYRRMDEWIPSYQNILSTTALDCRRILAKVRVVDARPAEFLQYTPDGTSEYLRLNAFENLIHLGFARKDKILRWLMFVLGTDPSPHVRNHLLRMFGQFLGSTAIGEHLEAAKAQEAIQDGLVIEQETTTEARRADLARKQTIEGALNALRSELSSNTTLKIEIWNAVASPTLSLHQMGDLLDFCDLLYTPETSMILHLKYPRYWKCTKVGKGNLHFSRTSHIRTTPMQQRLAPRTQSPNIKRENSNSSTTMPPPPQHPPLKLKFGGHKKLSVPRGPPTPTPVESIPSSPAPSAQGEAPKQKVMLKLKVGGASSPPPR